MDGFIIQIIKDQVETNKRKQTKIILLTSAHSYKHSHFYIFTITQNHNKSLAINNSFTILFSMKIFPVKFVFNMI